MKPIVIQFAKPVSAEEITIVCPTGTNVEWIGDPDINEIRIMVDADADSTEGAVMK